MHTLTIQPVLLAALLGLVSGAAAMAQPGGPVKAAFNNVIKLNAYADNWCMVYINGKLAGVDQIEFLPHNVLAINVLPTYPMTIAVLAKDNADPKTGLEYGTQIGDAGFILKLSDGTVTSSAWKAKSFFTGPLNSSIASPKVRYTPIPANWFAPGFDDSTWEIATEYTAARVNPDGDYSSYDFSGAKFIWTSDLNLDNTVIFRYTAPKPANYVKTWTADGDIDITNVVNEARLAPPPAPALFQVNSEGVAAGYVLRVRGAQQLVEQFAGSSIELGPVTDQVYLVLYGGNLPAVISATATIGGVAAEVAYAGALTPANGVAQFNLAIPRTLAGTGLAEVVVTVNGKNSNSVYVSIQ